MPILLQAQTKFIATINPQQAAKDEYITLKLTVENGKNVQQINPPNLTEFTLISGPNQEQAMNNVNGKVTQSISISYILQPKKPGNFTIGSSTAIADGKTYKSDILQITISNKNIGKAQQNNSNAPFAGMDIFEEPTPQKQFDNDVLKNGETIQDKVAKNMVLKLQTDKTSCYVGEPILANYKLYTRLKSESSMSKNPSFNGFSVVDMMQQIDQTNTKYEMLDGREYNTYTIRRAQLYPLQAGAIELETATLDNKITFVKYESSGSRNLVTENVSLSSKPIIINVKPLPEAGKPINFNGAVGDFNMEAIVEKNNFSTDETGLLRIVLSGKGNMQLLIMPEVKWPANVEAFEPKITDNLNNATLPISGSKTFEISFAVADTGNVVLPNIQFSFFNPATASYNTIVSKNITLHITKGNGLQKQKKLVEKNAKSNDSLTNNFIKNWLQIILFLVFLGAGIFIFILKKSRKKNKSQIIPNTELPTNENELPNLFSANKNYLEKTEQCLEAERFLDFYGILNVELKHFFATYLAVQKEQINSKTLALEMDKAGISNSLSLQAQLLLQRIELKLYTPTEPQENFYELYTEARLVIQTIISVKS